MSRKETEGKPKKATEAPVADVPSKPAEVAEKKVTAEEMKEALTEKIQVSEDQLRLLALERAERTQDFLLTSGKIEAKRVFLSEPKSIAPERMEKVKDSRVNFTLK